MQFWDVFLHEYAPEGYIMSTIGAGVTPPNIRENQKPGLAVPNFFQIKKAPLMERRIILQKFEVV